MQIAAVGVAIAIFNQASKVTIFPLVSITTSFVAEEETLRRMNEEQQKRDDLEKGSISDPINNHEVEDDGTYDFSLQLYEIMPFLICFIFLQKSSK